jgi:transposase InsO family protein
MSSDKMEKADGKEAVQHGADARVIIEAWRRNFNKVRPHASLGYRAPVPEVFVPALAGAWPAPRRASAPPAMLRPASEVMII